MQNVEGIAPIVDMADLAPCAAAHRIVRLAERERALAVVWEDGHESRLHYLWLRENCACPACRHPQTLERSFRLIDVPEDLRPLQAEVTPEGALRLRWPQQGEATAAHESLFDPGWLRAHCCAEAARSSRRRCIDTWDAERLRTLPSVDHAEVMAGDDGLRRWLAALARTGVALIRGGPVEDREVLRIAERVGPPRATNFGLHFDVVSKPKPNNSAYTDIELELHVDLPNWRRPPDFQLLYCLHSEAEGGDSVLVDGFRVAEALRAADPAAFELLASLPVDFRFQDEGEDIRCRAPTIGLGPDGEVAEIRFNDWIRDVVDAPEGRLDAFYRAYRRFWRLLRDPAYQVRFRLAPGEMVAFDNLRILHGREGFDPATGRRHLQGTYLDRDLVYSRLRVLQRRG